MVGLCYSTRNYLSRIVGLYDKKKAIMFFAKVLCMIIVPDEIHEYEAP